MPLKLILKYYARKNGEIYLFGLVDSFGENLKETDVQVCFDQFFQLGLFTVCSQLIIGKIQYPGVESFILK